MNQKQRLLEELQIKHPGHDNQKVHGNWAHREPEFNVHDDSSETYSNYLYQDNSNHQVTISEKVLEYVPKENILNLAKAFSFMDNWQEESKLKQVPFLVKEVWSSSSGGAVGLGLQKAASIVFGLESKRLDDRIARIKATEINTTNPDFEKQLTAFSGKDGQEFVRGLYKLTQDDLKKSGITHLTLYRGFNAKDREGKEDGHKPFEYETQTMGLSSFSTDIDIANNFGSHAFATRVPAEDILSTPRTGPGTFHEREVVVIGKKRKGWLWFKNPVAPQENSEVPYHLDHFLNKHPGHPDQKVHGNWATGNRLTGKHDSLDIDQDNFSHMVEYLLKDAPYQPDVKDPSLWRNDARMCLDSEGNTSYVNNKTLDKLTERLDRKTLQELDDIITATKIWPRPLGSGREAISVFLYRWGQTTGSSVSLALQKAAAAEFGLETSRLDARVVRLRSLDDERSPQPMFGTTYDAISGSPAVRKMLRAMYDQTQEELKAEGLDYVTVFRGHNPKSEILDLQEHDVKATPLSSWTSDFKIVKDTFIGAGCGLAARVPREDIFSTARTGLGTLHESEIVVLNKPRKTWAWGYGQDINNHGDLASAIRERKKLLREAKKSLKIKHPGHSDQNIHGNWAHDGDLSNRESKEPGVAAQTGQTDSLDIRLEDVHLANKFFNTGMPISMTGHKIFEEATPDYFKVFDGDNANYATRAHHKYMRQALPFDDMAKDFMKKYGKVHYPYSWVNGDEDNQEFFYDIIKKIGRGWNGNSSGPSPEARGFLTAIADEFGLDNSKNLTAIDGYKRPKSGQWVKNDTLYQDYLKRYEMMQHPVIRKYIRAVYEDTQRKLKDAGIDAITLYRGHNLKEPELYKETFYNERVIPAEVQTNPASSWSARWNIMTGFGDGALAARVSREDIFSTAMSGLGTMYEQEFVVLNRPRKAWVFKNPKHLRGGLPYTANNLLEDIKNLRKKDKKASLMAELLIKHPGHPDQKVHGNWADGKASAASSASTGVASGTKIDRDDTITTTNILTRGVPNSFANLTLSDSKDMSEEEQKLARNRIALRDGDNDTFVRERFIAQAIKDLDGPEFLDFIDKISQIANPKYGTPVNKYAPIEDQKLNAMNLFRSQWNASSNTSWSVGLQRAVAREFGLDTARLDNRLVRKQESWDEQTKQYFFQESKLTEGHPFVKKLVHYIYEQTQKQLQEAGLETVTLYRGGNSKAVLDYDAKEVELRNTPLSSFSADPQQAAGFGRHFMVANFPREHIFAHAATGLGTMDEAEYVVMGKPITGYAWMKDSGNFDTYPTFHKDVLRHVNKTRKKSLALELLIKHPGHSEQKVHGNWADGTAQHQASSTHDPLDVSEDTFEKIGRYLVSDLPVKPINSSIEALKDTLMRSTVNASAARYGARSKILSRLDEETKKALLTVRPGYKQKDANAVIDSLFSDWNSSTGYPSVMGFMNAVGQEFGLDTSRIEARWERIKKQRTFDDEYEQKKRQKEHDAIANSPAIRKLVRAIYDLTQEELKAAGIERVTVYRGHTIKSDIKNKLTEDAPVEYDIEANPLSSYTTDYERATHFNAHLLAMSVPREHVFSTMRTGPGTLWESEVVVLNKPGQRAWAFPNGQDDDRPENVSALQNAVAKKRKKTKSLLFKHPGHADQKVHGNWAGGQQHAVSVQTDSLDIREEPNMKRFGAILHEESRDLFSNDSDPNVMARQIMRMDGEQFDKTVVNLYKSLKGDKDLADLTELYKKDGWEEFDDFLTIRHVLDQWNGGTNSITSLALADIAGKMFGLDASRLDAVLTKQREEDWSLDRSEYFNKLSQHPGMKKILKTIYDKTQETLRAAGVDEITLYRGHNYKGSATITQDPQEVELDGRPLMSFTSRYRTSGGFNKDRIAIRVPREKIVSLPNTGFGMTLEFEFTVMNNIGKGWVWKSEDENQNQVFKEESDLIQAIARKRNKKKLLESLDILVKHPGHTDQSVHGNWAHDGDLANRESKVGGNYLDINLESTHKADRYLFGDDYDRIDRESNELYGTTLANATQQLAARLVNNPDFEQFSRVMNNDNNLNGYLRNTHDIIEKYLQRPLTEPEKAIGLLLVSWEDTSNGINGISNAIQRATVAEFGLDHEKIEKSIQSKFYHPGIVSGSMADLHRKILETYSQPETQKGLRAFLKTMHEYTQDELEKAGVDQVTVYRGVNLDLGEVERTGMDIQPQPYFTKQNPLGSFSTSYSKASEFTHGDNQLSGQTMFAVNVPRRDILSTGKTGFGLLAESEVVVLAKKNRAAWGWVKRKPNPAWKPGNTTQPLELGSGIRSAEQLRDHLRARGLLKKSLELTQVFTDYGFGAEPYIDNDEEREQRRKTRYADDEARAAVLRESLLDYRNQTDYESGVKIANHFKRLRKHYNFKQLAQDVVSGNTPQQAIIKLLGTQDHNTLLSDLFTRLYTIHRKGYEAGAQAIVSSLEPNRRFRLRDYNEIGMLRAKSWRQAEKIERATRNYIEKELKACLDQGITDPDYIAERLEILFNKWSNPRSKKSRSMFIAVTETSNGMGTGFDAMLEKNDIRKKWLALHDERCCDACDDNARMVPISPELPFLSGHHAPPAHPHCRCGLVPVLESDEHKRLWTGGTDDAYKFKLLAALDITVKHPGHDNQKVHGNWARGNASPRPQEALQTASTDKPVSQDGGAKIAYKAPREYADELEDTFHEIQRDRFGQENRIFINLDKLDPPVAKEATAAFADVVKRVPELSRVITEIGAESAIRLRSGPNAVAVTFGSAEATGRDSSVFFNANMGHDERKIKALLKGEHGMKWWTPGNENIKGIVTHELGHVLMNALNTTSRKKLEEKANFYLSTYNNDILTHNVSGYATRNKHEFLAEIFARHMGDPTYHNELTQEIGTEMLEALKKSSPPRQSKKKSLELELDIIKHPGHSDQKAHGNWADHSERAHAESTSATRFAVSDKAKLKSASLAMFGRELTNDEISRMTGAPAGSVITLTVEENWTFGADGARQTRGWSIKADIDHHDYYDQTSLREYHFLYPRGKGKKPTLYAKNELLALRDDAPAGLGTRIFATQVDQLSKLGFTHIVTVAAGGGAWHGPEMSGNGYYNGYYTWPRLGYNAKMGENANADLTKNALVQARQWGSDKDALLKNLSDDEVQPYLTAPDVRSFLALPHGPELWKRYGVNKVMEFDLSDGSESRKILDAYLKAKQLKLKRLELVHELEITLR